MIKKTLIFCILMVLSSKMALAHNPLSAMYYFEVKGELGILNVSLSQAGLQEALLKHYSGTDFSLLTEVDYKQLAVDYIKENFHLTVNGDPIYLENGGLKLGNHQTDLKFISSELPKEFNNLDVAINAFRENDHHQTIFSWSLNGITDKLILKGDNEYRASVVFKNNKMVVQNRRINTNYLWFIAIVPFFIVGRKLLLSPKLNQKKLE